jgi:hypothetical protein
MGLRYAEPARGRPVSDFSRSMEDDAILRLWRGWTTPESADRYHEFVATAIFPGILARTVAGPKKLEPIRRPIDDEVEFMTIMRFESWEAGEGFRRSGPRSLGRAACRPRCTRPLR